MEDQEDLTFKMQSLRGRTYNVHCYPSSSGLTVYYTDITLQEEIFRRQNEFIGIASHELKTPLTSIQFYAQLLHKHAKNCDKTSLTLVDILTGQIERLKELTNDIFDTSTIQTGQLNLKKKTLDLTSLVAGVVQDNQQLAIQHTITLYGKTTYMLSADKVRISQVLNNLITNAIKYSPHTKKIIVRVRKDKNGLLLSVCKTMVSVSQKENKQMYLVDFIVLPKGKEQLQD